MRIEQIKIFQEASYKTIEREFNQWVRDRLTAIRALERKDAEKMGETLGIPSNTHLQYDQGLQKYIFTVVYLEDVEEF